MVLGVKVGRDQLARDHRRVLDAALRRVDRFMAAHPWDHNQHYHRWLLRQVPAAAESALDVGCGTGDLARALAARGLQVDAVDINAQVIDRAKASTPDTEAVKFRTGTFLDSSGPYDVITAVASLHHVEVRAGLRCLHRALAPGGVLLVVGCYREATPCDHLVGAAAIPANLAAGIIKNPRPRERPVPSMTAPTRAPATTLREVRDVVRDELPGAVLQRALFWRYLLRYVR